jgi:glycosyltransferase involved in cell wall biosynthesis
MGVAPRSVKTGFRILHCLRAPVGGLFRHVCDLAAAQSRACHEVAVVCADTGNALTTARLDALGSEISLGVHRVAMGREMGFGDARATQRVLKLARSLDIDVLHGHGAKGGAYARLASRLLRFRGAAPLCIYTPHGGTLHFDPVSKKGRVLFALEKHLEVMTNGIIFESAYSAERYAALIGPARTTVGVVANGVGPADFEPIQTNADATDLLFVGELRTLKGVDVLLDAMAAVSSARSVTTTIVGDGPDADAFKAQAQRLGLGDRVRFPGARPARDAFKMGHTLIIPSRAESFPYIVLEAGAARKPLITTRVGGIPEIIGDSGTPMLAPGDVPALTAALFDALAAPDAGIARAAALCARIAGAFSVTGMTDAVLDVYRAAAVLRSASGKSGQRRLRLSA